MQQILKVIKYEKMKSYKAVFIDWDDTIGDWTGAEHQALRDIYEMYALKQLYPTFEDYLNAYKPYNQELWGRYGRGEVSKEYLHFERFYRPLVTVSDGRSALSGESWEDIAREMGGEFLRLTNKYFSLIPDAENVVRYLASKYPLTIISNGFKEVQYYKFEHSGLRDCLTHVLISEEVGINKPQPEIFRIALQRNGITADQAIMIGDSYSSDIAGAQSAGIDQLWIKAQNEIQANETATYIVPKLTDVPDIL